MYLLILTIPLLSSVLCGLFGRLFGGRGCGVLSTSLLFITFLLSATSFYEVGICNSVCSIELGSWFSSGLFDCTWGFWFDGLTVLMLVVITSISTLVHLYSISYMGIGSSGRSGDPFTCRFMSYLSLFTFFMIMLVTGDNLLVMFLGWEGVGVCSYLLINFWYTRIQANKASLKAMIVNRIGDASLSLGIMSIFVVFKSINVQVISSTSHLLSGSVFSFFSYDLNAFNVICVLLTVGAIGKSAQLGLHIWLADAMEGPTPVSALIHAATMVTAGVFLFCRCSYIFEYSARSNGNGLEFVAIVGGCTCLFAGTCGIFQNDLKRVIAFSTCSQLGYMVFACGLSNYDVALFHLFNHAFFKALLFLGAGSIIHGLNNNQDMRLMGGCHRLFPLSYSLLVLASLSLCGLPFLSGFYSKDLILEYTEFSSTVGGQFCAYTGYMSVFFTAFYSFRLIMLTFSSDCKIRKEVIVHAHDSSMIQSIVLILLSLASCFSGYVFSDMFIGVGTDYWGSALAASSELKYHDLRYKFLPLFKWDSIEAVILGVLVAHYADRWYTFLYITESAVYFVRRSILVSVLSLFSSKRWFLDKVSLDCFGIPALVEGHVTFLKKVDKGFLEFIGVKKMCSLTLQKDGLLSRLQTGIVYNYALSMVVGILVALLVCSRSLIVFPGGLMIVLLSVLYSLFWLPLDSSNQAAKLPCDAPSKTASHLE